jgi:hypothetical protein
MKLATIVFIPVITWLSVTSFTVAANVDMKYFDLPVDEKQYEALTAKYKTLDQQQIVTNLNSALMDVFASFNVPVVAILTDWKDDKVDKRQLDFFCRIESEFGSSGNFSHEFW